MSPGRGFRPRGGDTFIAAFLLMTQNSIEKWLKCTLRWCSIQKDYKVPHFNYQNTTF